MRSTVGLNRFQRERAEQRQADEVAHAQSVEKMSGPTLDRATIFEYQCELGHRWTLEWPAGTLVAACVAVCFGEGHASWLYGPHLPPVRRVSAHGDNEMRFILPGEKVPPMTVWSGETFTPWTPARRARYEARTEAERAALAAT